MTVSNLQGQHPRPVRLPLESNACTAVPMGQAKAIDLLIVSSRTRLKAAELL